MEELIDPPRPPRQGLLRRRSFCRNRLLWRRRRGRFGEAVEEEFGGGRVLARGGADVLGADAAPLPAECGVAGARGEGGEEEVGAEGDEERRLRAHLRDLPIHPHDPLHLPHRKRRPRPSAIGELLRSPFLLFFLSLSLSSLAFDRFHLLGFLRGRGRGIRGD